MNIAAPLWHSLCESYSVSLRPNQKKLVEDYLDLLAKWNPSLHLTSIRSTEEILRFHFFEAFWVAERFLRKLPSVVDVGSGGGFPGACFKLYLPELAVVLIERAYKKSVFLEQVAAALRLDFRVYRSRAENYPYWPETAAASLRALKPSSALLTTLAAHQVQLFWFHGSDQPRPPAWALAKRERIPGSRGRFISVFLPVSRETTSR